MASFLALSFFKFLVKKLGKTNVNNILILGLTFKENCPDLRNSKVFDLISEFESLGLDIDVFDPLVEEKSKLVSNINLLTKMPRKKYSGVALQLIRIQ